MAAKMDSLPRRPWPASVSGTRSGRGISSIAHESLEYGWWEAIVVARKDNVFTLRYRDFPSLPKFSGTGSASP